MSITLKSLIYGRLRVFLRPLHCTRVVRSRDASQEGPHGDINDPDQQPYDILCWEDLQPPIDVQNNDLETSPPVQSYEHSNTTKMGRRDSWTRVNFIKPDVSVERLQAADSIISIVFGMQKLAWAHVDRNLMVRDCHQHEWLHLGRARQHPDLYLEDMSSAISKFPAADLYLLEKNSLSTQKTSMFPVTLHLRIVEAMLYAMLNPSYTVEREHRVFSMARTTVGKHFDIMVGGSKTSGVGVVQRLVKEAGTMEQPRVCFPQDMITQYVGKFQPRGQNRNEELCDALLQAIAFYELLYK